jgi:hypothetical protein
MKIIAFPNRRGRRERPVVDAPLRADRIMAIGDEIVVGVVTSMGEWRLVFDRHDVGILGAALSRLTGSRPPD